LVTTKMTRLTDFSLLQLRELAPDFALTLASFRFNNSGETFKYSFEYLF